MRRNDLAPLSSSLFIQAAVTAFFTLSPLGGESGGWRAFELLLAALAAAVGVFLRGGSPQSRTVVLGFEAFAIAVGAVGFVSQHMYIPGTIIGIGVLIRVLNLPSQPAAPVMPYGQPQYGAQPQYGQPEYGAQPHDGGPGAPGPYASPSDRP